MSATDVRLGTIVEVSVGRGVVRFSGATSFMAGKWIGIELYEPNGKNDGSVAGVSYFTCKAGYGIFVRASQIKAAFGSENDRPPPATVRPALGHQRTSSLRANSIRAPSVSLPSPRSASPAKPIAPPPVPAASPTKPRVLLAMPPRKSLQPTSPSAHNAESPSRPNGAVTTSSGPRLSSPLTMAPPRPPSPPSPAQPPSAFHTSAVKPPSRPSSSLSAHVPIAPAPAASDDQELRAKIRVLEAKRADDARHVRELETRLADAETFVSLRPKLQAKLNSQQTELIAARRDLADAQQLAQLAEGRLLDTQEQLEMAMLDKEVAEERAEGAEAELEDVTERLAIVEVELGVLKEGGMTEGEGEDAGNKSMSAGKDSLAYIQLEKHNDRLKEALLRLRDMSQETEQEQRRRIAEMEKDIVGLDDLQSNYETTQIKLANAEIQIEDLKMQLDDALGAEEMLVQLTERNLMLGEKIEEMRITIEDLESLRELNDELEENHVETEKALTEDLEVKDMQIREHVRKAEALEEACTDLEGTIGQFRDLVVQLQSELDSLRAQTQVAQTESQTASSQSAAMMSLNLKLQSSASKNQARNIELEIKRMEARETRELLNIVQPYLPQIYVETDSDATSCYLFFQRLAYKADLITTIVSQNNGLPDSLSGSVSDALVGVCDMRGRISALSTLCKRFAAVMRRCDVESFLNIGRLYQEIAPMEKRLDMHVDLLRRDEFREMECVSDVVKITAQFDHLAETYFSGFDYDLGERELGYLVSFDLDLDIFAASIGMTKTSITTLVQDDETVLDLGGFDIDTELFEPLQRLLDQYKGAKALSKKLTKRVEDLIQDSTALKAHLVPQMKALSNFVPELVNFGISFAQQIMPHLSDVRSSKSPFQLTTILSFVKQIAASTVAKDMKPGVSAWEAIGESITQLVQEGSKLLPLALEPENVIKVSGVSPWVTRVDEVKASVAVNLEAERRVTQLNEELQGLVRTLKQKEQHIQEATVKNDLMERKMETVKRQADSIAEKDIVIADSKRRQRELEEALEQVQGDLDVSEQERLKLKTVVGNEQRQASGTIVAEPENLPVEGSLETSHLLDQIDALRGTVRYLRTENAYLKGQDLLREIEALPPLPEPISRIPTPPLDPSGLSDSDESDSEDRPHSPPTLRSLATETKILYRDVIKFSSSPRVVDLSALNAKRTQANGGRVWMPKKSMPAHQVWERKMEAERLNRRVRGLLDKASVIGGDA
ncbi:dynein associated protein-domain-containing protein [Mycena belliarum]|uniref:Dynein associated protein-domain-containing protein n=1 Tax=Mycena belliarum TaxID=1033014 RepID=A0AAD6XHI6_9AGAR|nr:dynein associated protein-domain-containing protein [Mycena belliae]